MFQMNRVAEAPADVDDAGRSTHFTASLSGALEHLEALTAILRHLRHERQPFEMPVFVECRKDLLLLRTSTQFPAPNVMVMLFQRLNGGCIR